MTADGKRVAASHALDRPRANSSKVASSSQANSDVAFEGRPSSSQPVDDGAGKQKKLMSLVLVQV